MTARLDCDKRRKSVVRFESLLGLLEERVDLRGVLLRFAFQLQRNEKRDGEWKLVSFSIGIQ